MESRGRADAEPVEIRMEEESFDIFPEMGDFMITMLNDWMKSKGERLDDFSRGWFDDFVEESFVGQNALKSAE